MNFHRFLPLLAALALGACVTSKTPVGDKVATLDPKIWNAKWQDGSGAGMSIRIKDAKLGLVEVVRLGRWTKPKEGDPERADVLIRMLGNELIANELQGGVYNFERIYNDGTHLVAFDPEESVFEGLIRQHQLPGLIDRDKKGNSTGSCIIDRLTERDYQRLKKEGFAVRTLFKEDPAKVFVRDHGIW